MSLWLILRTSGLQFFYLRWLKACSQCEPSTSLPLVRSPLLWLRALSPIKAWASSASSLWPQTSWALCSASWSPAALNSLWSCHRFTLLKMFPEPAFLLLLLASRQSEEGPATMKEGGVAGLVSIWRKTGKGGIDCTLLCGTQVVTHECVDDVKDTKIFVINVWQNATKQSTT